MTLFSSFCYPQLGAGLTRANLERLIEVIVEKQLGKLAPLAGAVAAPPLRTTDFAVDPALEREAVAQAVKLLVATVQPEINHEEVWEAQRGIFRLIEREQAGLVRRLQWEAQVMGVPTGTLLVRRGV